MGTRLGDKHPTRFRRVQGELNFEEIPSSVQDSEILGSWMRIKHKWKAMESASYPEAGSVNASVSFPWFLAVHHQSLASTLWKTKRLRRRLKWDGENFITLENKHVLISWSSASASVSDNLAPVLQKLDSALAPVRRFPSPSQSIHYGDVSKANEQTTWPKVWPCEIMRPRDQATIALSIG